MVMNNLPRFALLLKYVCCNDIALSVVRAYVLLTCHKAHGSRCGHPYVTDSQLKSLLASKDHAPALQNLLPPCTATVHLTSIQRSMDLHHFKLLMPKDDASLCVLRKG